MELSDKTVLLTGALGSLGRAQAKVLGAAGARLLLLDRPGDVRCEELLAALDREGIKAEYLGQDLNDLSGTHNAISSAASRVGVDVLINNAAVIVNRPFEEFTLEEYEQQIRVNSSAAFVAAQAVAPSMRERRAGSIINFSSLTRNGQWTGYAPYAASKGAIVALTTTLARELGSHGIRVNAITPGAVQSEAEERVFGHKLAEYQDWILERQCLKQRIQPEDIAQLVLFVASDRSKMITGQEIHMNAGW